MARKRPVTKLVPVSQAAKLMHMTPGGVYGAIKAKRIAATKVDGRWMIDRAAAIDYYRRWREWLRETERIKRGDLTDEEFIQRMIDNDPD